MLVTLIVFQSLMSLLNVDTHLLSEMRLLMSVTRDTCRTRPEQSVGKRGWH